ncbi:hypothetical protein X975_04547, partial [Stegodyphus mimosarum]
MDLFLIQETHLVEGLSANIANYFCYRNDREVCISDTVRASGGTSIYIKRSIKHSRIPTPPLEALEATIIQIHIPNC